MKPKVMAFAGRSGSGKSTLAAGIAEAFPGDVQILGLDNYQRSDTDAPDFPWQDGFKNWDHPRAILWESAKANLGALAAGWAVSLNVWRHPANPDFMVTGKMRAIEVEPRPLIIFEGNQALSKCMRPLYHTSVYLDSECDVSIQRRLQAREGQTLAGVLPKYIDNVLIPAEARYVTPTKEYADYTINTTRLTQEQCLHELLPLAEKLIADARAS